MIITIDGPAGSGKSTVARKLAIQLGFLHINQGALFRAVGLEAVARGVDISDDAAVSALAQSLEFSFVDGQLLVDGRALSHQLQTPQASLLASQVAVLPCLRNVLLAAQIEMTKSRSAVVEGRDAGSVGFPHAELKLYLDARLEVRAERRFAELCRLQEVDGRLQQTDGQTADLPTLGELTKQIAERDARDSSRSLAPMRQADDAVLIDTSALAPDEVMEKILALVADRQAQ